MEDVDADGKIAGVEAGDTVSAEGLEAVGQLGITLDGFCATL